MVIKVARLLPIAYLILMLKHNAYAGQNDAEQAAKATQQALVKQFQIDTMVGAYAKKLEQRYVDEDVKKVGGWLIIVGQTAATKSFKLTWHF